MGNVAVLGACVKLVLPDGLEFLEQAVAGRMGALAGANVLAAEAGYRRCVRQRARAGDTPVESVPGAREAPASLRPAPFAISSTDSLGNHTGAWADEQPVLADACTACALCALFCPEGAIARIGGVMAVDYLYCKGCGICEAVCPVRDAIRMEAVTA